METRLPNFLIVGAAKSGTTSLFHYLKQHPDIGVSSRKEGRFFSQMPDNFNGPGDQSLREAVSWSLDEYKMLFADVGSEKAVGEASPDYLYYYKNSIKNIRNYLDNDVKIIIILRNPVYKAHSQYFHLVKLGRETRSFEDALNEEYNRIKEGWEWTWYYTKSSFYYESVKAYVDEFGQNVFICLYEDFESHPQELIRKIFRFLGVDETFQPNMSVRFNTSRPFQKNFILRFIKNQNHPMNKICKYIALHTIGKERTERFVNYLIRNEFFRNLNLKSSEYKDGTKKKLVDIFSEDIIKLQGLINRDLSVWLEY